MPGEGGELRFKVFDDFFIGDILGGKILSQFLAEVMVLLAEGGDLIMQGCVLGSKVGECGGLGCDGVLESV